MKFVLLDALKRRSRLINQGRLGRFLKIPLRLAWPYVLGRVKQQQQVLATLFFGKRMLVILPEPVSVRIWRYGVFEPDVAFYLITCLRAGDTFIDIGGHFGFFSMLGRELVGQDGTVVTFEPFIRDSCVAAVLFRKHNMRME